MFHFVVAVGVVLFSRLTPVLLLCMASERANVGSVGDSSTSRNRFAQQQEATYNPDLLLGASTVALKPSSIRATIVFVENTQETNNRVHEMKL